LIAYSQKQPAIPLNTFIQLDALLAHLFRHCQAGATMPPVKPMTPKGLFCFHGDLEQLKLPACSGP
jgi:hypothetical protein